jgi:hypothetical protein
VNVARELPNHTRAAGQSGKERHGAAKNLEEFLGIAFDGSSGALGLIKENELPKC